MGGRKREGEAFAEAVEEPAIQTNIHLVPILRIRHSVAATRRGYHECGNNPGNKSRGFQSEVKESMQAPNFRLGVENPEYGNNPGNKSRGFHAMGGNL
ncbi:MAG: hypothetical protein GX455_02950 [Phycisphaerae bacterium]|nr:hypothetical protein [Phycisphaerae bacterium]